MATEKGFSLTLTSRYDEFWRYNVALMCGCFDQADQRTGFAASESHIADAGSALHEKPAEASDKRHIELTTEPCDHLVFYLYIIPHTLPRGNDIEHIRPFEVELTIRYAGKHLRSEKLLINQWSGASKEMRIGKTEN